MSRIQSRDSETGASLVEYSLLVALIAVISMTGISVFSDQTNRKLTDLSNTLDKAGETNDSGGCNDGNQCSGGGGGPS